MIFFTADTHFSHGNIIKYCNRPFSSADEMNEILIQNWNKKVTSKDTVYHLGDVGMGESIFKILQKLNGKIILILGNHDKEQQLKLTQRFQKICQAHTIKPKINNTSQEIFLNHYSHRTWAKAFHGTWHLFGHSHGNLPPYGKSFDIGVDSWNYFPVSLDEVAEKMKSLKNNENEYICS